jgi:hypothetical protein
MVLDGLPRVDVVEVLGSLTELGVVVKEREA